MKKENNSNLGYPAKLLMAGFAKLHQVTLLEDHESYPYVMFRHRREGLIKLGFTEDHNCLFLHWAWWNDEFKLGRRRVGGDRRKLPSLNISEISYALCELAAELENMDVDIFPFLTQDFRWSDTLSEEIIEQYVETIPYISNLNLT